MIAYTRMSDIPYPKESLLYRLLADPSYRVIRHLILVLAIGIVAVSQTTYSLMANVPLIGNRIYLIAAITFVGYLGVGYFHIYVLVPKLLLRKRYLAYVLVSCLTVFLITLLKPLEEYFTNELLGLPHQRSTYFNIVSLFDLLSDFIQILLCITGASVTVLLKNWLVESRRANELEKRRLQSEVASLKEQVNPELLFHTLNRTGNLAVSDPGKAADMVLRLSQLLRYELYDGSRDKVLLSAEVDFLKHYLTLEQFYGDAFDFEVRVSGDTRPVFVPPLLFIPFVQASVKYLCRIGEARPSVDLSFRGEGGQLFFALDYPGMAIPASELASVESRLRHLYPDRFSLSFGKDSGNGLMRVFLRLQNQRP